MRQILFVLLLIGTLGAAVAAQSMSDIKKKFALREFYEVRPEILMSANYNDRGEVCSLFFQPNHYSEKEKTVFVGNSSLNLYDFLAIVNEFAPVETRRGDGISMGLTIQGGMASGGFAFDNVRIGTKGPFPLKQARQFELIATKNLTESDLKGNRGLVEFLDSFGPPETA
jgi:hypothetical protein